MVRRKSGILLLTLVSFLIFILFIIVQLFLMKLRKAHVIWKKGELPKARWKHKMLKQLVANRRILSIRAFLLFDVLSLKY